MSMLCKHVLQSLRNTEAFLLSTFQKRVWVRLSMCVLLTCLVVFIQGECEIRWVFFFFNIVKCICTSSSMRKWWTKCLTGMFEWSNLSFFCCEGSLQTYERCSLGTRKKKKWTKYEHLWLNVCTYISLPLVMLFQNSNAMFLQAT